LALKVAIIFTNLDKTGFFSYLQPFNLGQLSCHKFDKR